MKNNSVSGMTTLSDPKAIKKECLRLLTRREHSRKQIQDKLTVKGFGKQQVNEVIDTLSDQNWQSDSRYAENYARMRSQKGFGPLRIAFELKQQGIDADTIEETLRLYTGEWPVLLEQIYLKKFARTSHMDAPDRSKQTRFLLQRGFSSDMIHSLLARQAQSPISVL